MTRLDIGGGANSSEIRILPISSNQDIVEDRVDGSSTASIKAAVQPQFLRYRPVWNTFFADVPLYVLQDNGVGGRDIFIVNPFTGETSVMLVGPPRTITTLRFARTEIFADSRGASVGPTVDSNSHYLVIDPGTAAATIIGNVLYT